jgi:hypothetical protein
MCYLLVCNTFVKTFLLDWLKGVSKDSSYQEIEHLTQYAKGKMTTLFRATFRGQRVEIFLQLMQTLFATHCHSAPMRNLCTRFAQVVKLVAPVGKSLQVTYGTSAYLFNYPKRFIREATHLFSCALIVMLLPTTISLIRIIICGN